MKNFVILLFLISIVINTHAQDQQYFNNIYNPENTYGSGRGILQIDNSYYGIFGTFENSDNWYKLAVFNMGLTGNLIDWNLIGEDNHAYFAGSVGGTLIKTDDGNLAFTCHVENPETVFGTLVKLNLDLDTIWSRKYFTEHDLTMTIKVKQTTDGGYIIVGHVYIGTGGDLDALLLKTDSIGNEEWHQIFGINSNSSEYGTSVLETPDGGYLMGGFKQNTAVSHSLDAMVIKTDSLGNEEWTKYYGNPDVDDDMALVTMADDGNYLVATVYGEWIHTPMIRTGRVCLIKIDNNGNTIWDKKIGPKRRSINIKNIRNTPSGDLIATGWSYTDTISEWIYDGWIHKFSEEGDSIWWRDYYHYHNQYDRNFFYDVSPTSDNGYIAIGKARPDMGGENNMWIVKMDSMGCDTPGCFTTAIPELSPSLRGQGEVLLWPNPATELVTLSTEFSEVSKCEPAAGKEKMIRVYNSLGFKVEEIKVHDGVESMEVDVSKYTNGLYYLQYIHSNQIMETVKFIKN